MGVLVAVIVYTSGLWYQGPDRLDIALWTDDPAGRVLAPHLGETMGAYAGRLFGLHQARRRVFDALAALDTVTVCCSCFDAAPCHRTALAARLVQLGATMGGERPREALPFPCGIRFCGAPNDTGYALCAQHWCMLPADLQRDLVANYTENQRYTGHTSREWMRLMGIAFEIIRQTEEQEKPEPAPAPTDGKVSVMVEPKRTAKKTEPAKRAPRRKGGWRWETK